MFYKIGLFYYEILKFCLYVFDILIEFILFLDFLLSLLGGICKYLFLLFLPILIYAFLTFFIILITFNNNFYNGNFNFNLTIVNILDDINESNTFSLTNKFILPDQEEIISASTSSTNTITSYTSLIFYLISAIFSCIFYTKGNFAITKRA